MPHVTDIKTVKKGQKYYATVNGSRLSYRLNAEGTAVLIYGKDTRYGGFYLNRFGGELSPAGIRQLHA
jgi:hypothetical protein